jgi:hypothetical protein
VDPEERPDRGRCRQGPERLRAGADALTGGLQHHLRLGDHRHRACLRRW